MTPLGPVSRTRWRSWLKPHMLLEGLLRNREGIEALPYQSVGRRFSQERTPMQNLTQIWAWGLKVMVMRPRKATALLIAAGLGDHLQRVPPTLPVTLQFIRQFQTNSIERRMGLLKGYSLVTWIFHLFPDSSHTTLRGSGMSMSPSINGLMTKPYKTRILPS